MTDRGHLERRFDAAMRNTYDEAARLGYRPTRFLEIVSEHGGGETAHRLLATEQGPEPAGRPVLSGVGGRRRDTIRGVATTRKPAKETMMIPATTDDCPMTEECPGYDRDRGVCLVRSGDCEFAPMAADADQVADAHVDEVSPGDSIGS